MPNFSITIPVGNEPRDLAVAPDGRHVYLTHGYGSPFKLTVIDTATNQVVATILPDAGLPGGVVVSPDGRRVYVTHVIHKYVSVIETATNSLITAFRVEVSPGAVAVTPDGRYLYVTSELNNVGVIDTTTHALVATIPVGNYPSDVAVTPDGRHAYVASTGSKTVSVIDTAVNAVVATVPFDWSPQYVAVSPDGRNVYVEASGVSVIDTSTNAVVTSIPSSGGSDIGVSPDGRFLYVNSGDWISVIDIAMKVVVAKTRLAPFLNSDIAVTGQNLYVTNHHLNTVSVFRIDGLQHWVDRSAEFGTPPAAGPPTACVIPGLGVHNIAYRDTSGRLHELWRDAQAATGTTNLTANAGAPKAAGNPFAYVDTSRNTEILLFRGSDGTVRSLYWSTGPVGHDNLSGTAGAPKAAGDPVGYYNPADDSHHVIYRSGDGHLHELNWTGVAPVAYGGNLTKAISAPRAAGDPTAFVNAAGVNIVVYRAVDGRILGLYWANGPSGLDDLSGTAGTPPAAGDPFAYYTAHNDTHQVVYRANDSHLYELYWPGVAPVIGWDLTEPFGVPAASERPAAYYDPGTNLKHVIYRAASGRLRDLWWGPGGTPRHVDLTAFAGAPEAADRATAFPIKGPTTNIQHVAYRGTNKRIYEVLWGDRPIQHLVNRSAEFGTPPAAGPPTACVIPGLGVHNIAYRDTSGRLHELWRDAQGATGTTNLTANAGAPKAAGNPFAYVDTSRNTEILLFRGSDGTVRSLYWSTGPVGHDNLSGTAGAPKAAGDPVGYYNPADDSHHVIYRSGDGHLHELNWTGVAPVAYGGNLTKAISAPRAAGDPTAFVNAAGVNIVVYRAVDGRILGLYWANGPSGLDDLSGTAGTPPAAGDPFAYYTAHNDTHQVVYRANDSHLYELYWPGVAPVIGWDLTEPFGVPAASERLAAYYDPGTNVKHVISRYENGRLHDLWWGPGGGGVPGVDLTEFAGAPTAADRPAAFIVERPNTNTHHVAYRGTDKHIYEVLW